MRTRGIGMLAAAVASVMVVSACNAGSTGDDPAESGTGTGAGPSDPGVEDDSLTIGLVAEPASLDFTTTDGAAIPQALLTNVYETLVKVDQDGEIVPSLASEWEVDDARTVYTFTLQEGVTFSNGADLTAEDVVFSIERVQSDDWTVSLKAGMDVVESVEATGDLEVTVTLSRPSNQWLYAMTTRIGAIFDTDGVEDLATEPIGTGPFVFDTWEQGSHITLVRNEEYWGEAPYFGQVTLRYFDDATALNNAMLTGSLDVVGTVQAPESLGEFDGGDFQIIEGTSNGEVVLSMNNARAPFDDLRVRQAVRHAIDHPTLLEICWAGRGTLIGTMVPPTDPWYEDRTGDYPFDPDQAAQLLADAGAEGAQVRLRVPNLPYAVACGTVVESMLEEVGFEVTVDQLQFPAVWLEDVFTNHDYEMSIIAHAEPRDLGAVFGNPDYYTQFGTSELQELLQEADAAGEQEQADLMRQAAELISQEAAADFLFLLPNLMVADPDITGLPENAVTESLDLSGLGRG